MVSSASVRKILFLAANPQGTSRLRLDHEVRDIEEGLRRSQHREQFDLEQRWAVRPRDVQRAMLELNPQIVHFSGHGEGSEFVGETVRSEPTRKLVVADGSVPAASSTATSGLVFEDEGGKPKLVSGAALAGLFGLFKARLECVVLNGCYSATQAEAIAQHIPYVIGMTKTIGDRAALEFAVGFYDALGAGRSIEDAYRLGCVAIQMAGIAEHLTPVLLQKPKVSETIAANVPTIESPPSDPASMSTENSPIEVFFSYAHEDESLRNELAKHLKLLERQKVITAWYDRDITAGGEWRQEIERQLNSAQIILLLISADFLASDFCWSVELERAMERQARGEACVIPIILREVDWHGAPFGKLQGLPKNVEPVTSWANRDQAFADIARGIRKAIESLKK
ncbi:MAG TPA: TIR domain-containing protein [Coleofasciculaceae cyanobacterium]|jgi:hypothetical protein